ncbi:MAG: hypothetical protein ACXVYB_00290 [Arthrobacter sp.]
MTTNVYAGNGTGADAPNPWPGMSMLWTGYDGVVWDLTSGRDGVCMLPGVRGLTMPQIAHHKSVTASVPGANWRGSSTQEREVFWPIQIYHNVSSEEWVARDRAFWATLQPQRTGAWTVVQPSGERRNLTLRFRDDGSQAFNTDPVMAGWSNYGITLDAEQPYWEGTAVTKTWKVGSPTPFFGTSTGIVTISSGMEATTAKITNAGDVETYPVWTLKGPLSSASLSVGGRAINVGFDIPSGSTLTIDTSPSALTAMMGSTDKIKGLASSDFAPIPVGKDIPVTLAVVGTGSVTVTFTPMFYRAW